MGRNKIVRAILVLSSLASLVACEPDEGTKPPSPRNGTTTTSPVLEAPLGSFRYEGLGVEAVLGFEGPEAVLRVVNSTQQELGEPRLYVLRADDGSLVDLVTQEPAPISAGTRSRFTVVMQDGRAPIGMVFLRLGDDDFGAFVPVTEESG